MYYKDSPYGQASFPQQAGAAYPQQAGAAYSQNIRAPLLPHGYDGGDMYGNTMDTIKNTIKGYFSNTWVIVATIIIIVILIAWMMSGKKEGYYNY